MVALSSWAIFSNAELATVTDEKGSFTAAHRTFDPNSTFGAVLSTIAREDDVIVCDDPVMKWADFVGFRTDPASQESPSIMQSTVS